VLVASIVAYALSPIDLIPDFIPVLGYLDDLIIIPAGIALALRLIPRPVMEKCRAKAKESRGGQKSRIGAVIVIGIWLITAAMITIVILKVIK
jgi:uncharacterized membrane protein YkvA (DUF1232 family)